MFVCLTLNFLAKFSIDFWARHFIAWSVVCPLKIYHSQLTFRLSLAWLAIRLIRTTTYTQYIYIAKYDPDRLLGIKYFFAQT